MTSRTVWGTMSNKPARHGRARPGASTRFGVSGWPLRRKVALALMIPLILAATLGGLRVRADLTEWADASSSAEQVTILRPAVAYLTAAERALVAVAGGTDNSQADLNSAVQDLKAAASDLESTKDSADLTAEQRYQVDVILDLSLALRQGETGLLTAGTWEAQLRQLQSGVTQLINTIANAQLDPEPRLEQLTQALSGRFSLAMQQARFAAVQAGETGPLVLRAELGAESSAIDRLASALGDSEPAITALRTANSQRSFGVATKKDKLFGLGAYAEYDELTSKFLDDIDNQLDANASDARNRAIVSGGITVAALLAAIILALIVSRALLNPIRKVREGTLAAANERLPDAVAKIRAGGDPGPIEPIDVMTHEEIGTMARAVDDLHRQAVLLASREAGLRAQVAEMFVTLSRRHNSLINQQLDLIETLEKDEEDPRRLESLFRLDHLAARMRRTAESLLVLADAPPTRAAATEELTVSAALQAAIAAVQHYQRVQIGSTDDSRISDVAAADVVHVLTELVDNALAYSSPSTNVSLEAVKTRDGVKIEISDAGLGMTAGSLSEVNEILHSGGEVTPDTARRMGILVVSRLAQRHGISVSLEANRHGGITAKVVLPAAILERGRPSGVAPKAAGAPSLNRVLPEQRRSSTAPDGVGLGARPEPPPDLPSRAPVGLPPAPATPASSPVNPPRRGPLPAVPTAAEAAESDLPWTGDGEGDTPIFKAMRSAWLSVGSEIPWISTEVEVGWDRADQVARSSADTQVSASGLPIRQPGNRLVPGGVTKAATGIARDPEAVRARLAAHARGVARGRSAAASSDHSSTEVGPS
jgi:signal transduction histidine kinase